MSIYQLAIDHYGKQKQVIKAIEECAELIQILAKMGPCVVTKEDEQLLLSEIADVEIMLEQLKLIYSVDSTQMKEFKLARLLSRMQKKGAQMAKKAKKAKKSVKSK